MDDLTGIGSADAGNPNGGNGEEAQGSASNATAAEQGQQPTDAGNLDWAKAKGWIGDDGNLKPEKGAEFTTAYRSLETKLGGMISIPDDKSKPEDVDAFHKKLGWPGDAKAYEFKAPENMPKAIPYDQGMADWFKGVANEAKLPVATAQALHDKFIMQSTKVTQAALDDAATQFEQGLTTKAKSAHDALVKEWGATGTPEYIQSRDAAARALRSDGFKGLEQELRESGFLTKEGHFTSPLIAKLLASQGRQMQNDGFAGNGSGAAGVNPFAKGTLSLSEQTQLVRNDPQSARKLMAAAGYDEARIASVLPG